MEDDAMTSLSRRFVFGIALSVLGATLGLSVHAEEFGTADEAKAMVARAAAFLREKGKEQALPVFGDPKGAFIDRDLYVIAYALADGARLAHPYNPQLVGKTILDAKDVDGKPYGQEIIDLAKSKGSGWIDYKYTDPTTKKLAAKSLYIETVGDVVLGCGIYKR
jgi:cytochrome c